MPNVKNPRRIVLAHLALLRDWTAIMRSAWGIRMTTYDPDGTHARRPLRPDERPENSADDWERLAKYMEAIIVRASEVREYAIDRRDEVKEGKQW